MTHPDNRSTGRSADKNAATRFFKSTVLATTALSLGVGFAAPAMAQDSDSAVEAGDIVVTARRVEERLQDVPISMTVFNQEQLSDRNIVTPADLANYTPSMRANQRYGDTSSSFSIRGFAQEQRTTASVATYFADVVTPRGGSTTFAGDGAGPGALFDLQNVQVLKGPQGTLFGRNTTGGAVLLVPQRPTDEFGGYLEATAGDYDLRRVQGVLNVPLGDSARLRIGMDRNQRDGYLENQSSFGPDDFGNTDYESYRVSFVADLAPNLENYSIASYTHSLTNGSLPQQNKCLPAAPLGGFTCTYPNMNIVGAEGSYDGGFYDVWNSDRDPHQQFNTWQFINTTTWDVSDLLTARAIVSYAEVQSVTRADVFGTYWDIGFGPFVYANSSQGSSANGLDSANQSTYSAELQFQGRSSDDRLTWQAGLYFEESDPLEPVGSVSESLLDCSDTTDPDPGQWTCVTAGGGQVSQNFGAISFQNQALYAQATYAITERLKLTGGYRYTWDRTDGFAQNQSWNDYTAFVPGNDPTPECVDTAASLVNGCLVSMHQRSEAPTWTIGLDYNLTEDNMVYAKYSRGYRQGSVNVFSVAGAYEFGPEQANSYEVGLKSTFRGDRPGIFNVALFYNDLADAQLETAIVPFGGLAGSPTTAIVNAGGTTTYGLEIETSVELFENFNAFLGYSWLNTRVDAAPPAPSFAPGTQICDFMVVFANCYFLSASYTGDQELRLMPENQLTVGVSYMLPLPETVGDVTLGATYSYTDEQITTYNSTRGVIPSYGLLGLNLNWDGIGGSSVDGQVFVTNALDEEYHAYITDLSGLGLTSATPGAPRMIGARLRYRFGGEAN